MDESTTLKTLFEDIPKGQRAQFCRDNDIPGGVAMVYQHINGIKPISLQAAVGYAIGFNKPLCEISPRLAAIIDRLPKISPALMASEATKPHTSNVVALNTENPLRRELADIALRMNDTALQVLLYEAKKIEKEFPSAKANPAS